MSTRRWFAILALLSAIVAAMWLTGCQVRGSNQPGCPGTGSTLVAIGQWGTAAGCAAVGAGTLALVASFFPWTAFLSVFRPLITEVIALGGAAILLGTSCIWLGEHTWILAVVVLLVCAGFGIRYRNRIRRFLGLATQSSPTKSSSTQIAKG